MNSQSGRATFTTVGDVKPEVMQHSCILATNVSSTKQALDDTKQSSLAVRLFFWFWSRTASWTVQYHSFTTSAGK